MTYLYATRSRPAMYGTVPEGFTVVSEEQTDLTPFGTISYPEPLGAMTCYKYELRNLFEDYKVGDAVEWVENGKVCTGTIFQIDDKWAIWADEYTKLPFWALHLKPISTDKQESRDMTARTPKALDTLVLIYEQGCRDTDLIENLHAYSISLEDVAQLRNRYSIGNAMRRLSWSGAAEAYIVWNRLSALSVNLSLHDVANAVAIKRQYASDNERLHGFFAFDLERATVESLSAEYTLIETEAITVAIMHTAMQRCGFPIPVHEKAAGALAFAEYLPEFEETQGE